MEAKRFIYQSYLDKFEKCPMESCIERNVKAFRWVHSEPNENDFKPNIDHPAYPERSLDDSDLICEEFCLSVYKDFESSKKKYFEDYNKRKNDLAKQKFVSRKGNSVALLCLEEKDGICDEPTKEGHFNFFPYVEFNYSESIKHIFINFVFSDTDKNISDC